MATSERAIAERLAACGAASVYEALDKRFALPPTIRPVWQSGALAGPVFTVSCAAADNLALHRAVAEAPPGVVIVAAVTPSESAVWGSLLSSICCGKGVLGVVMDGRARDSDRIRELAFPLFCTGLTLVGCTKSDPGTLQAPIRLGPVTVAQGDWIVADGDGAVVVPAGLLDDVVRGAEAVERREAEIVRRAVQGETTIEQLGLQSLIDAGA